MRKVLILDLSTTATGYALFDRDTKALLEYGALKPNKKLKGEYPFIQLAKMRDLAEQIKALIDRCQPEALIVEEIVSHKARLTGKTLDGLHYIVVDRLYPCAYKLAYVDVSEWRRGLGIRLSDYDKQINKERRKFNKKAGRGQKLAIVDWKTLSSRYVNKRYGLTLNPDELDEDGDKADAIAVGTYWLERL